MRTLANAADVTAIRTRIASLTAGDKRLWGTMTVGGMVCHLADSFRFALGEFEAGILKVPIPPRLMKWLALRAPMKWPKGTPTLSEVKQGVGGTAPGEFEADRATLLDAVDKFTVSVGPWPRHPIFLEMTQAEWMRWGYLHGDHHLRQFGR